MADGVDRTVLIVSALAAFFATLFGVLLALEPDSAPIDTPAPIVVELPDVAAPPPTEAHAIAPVETRRRVEQTLDELGVECPAGDCFSDF